MFSADLLNYWLEILSCTRAKYLMRMVRLFGLARAFCIPLQVFPPKENRLFPSLRNGKDSDFFQLENKTKLEIQETVQAQM